MRYHALACDYDGTLAHHGSVDRTTMDALESVRASGRKLLLVTGRELGDLFRVFPRPEIFDRIVAENGALLYRPSTREEKPLAEPPPREFAEKLIARGAERVSVGRVIVATWEPYQKLALEVIHEMQLELQVIFNKGAVMILPSGINKAFGLTHALEELCLSPHNVVGVGDAENDHAFLALCECSVAVANGLEMIRQRADFVTKGDHGSGVQELIEAMLSSDLKMIEDRLRTKVVLGHDANGREVSIKPYGTNILIIDSPGGKSTVATALLESLAGQKYQFLIIDSEGGYSTFEHAILLGDRQRPPSVTEVLDVIGKVNQSATVNITGLDIHERPRFFEMLLPRILELRGKTGRPHWVLIDRSDQIWPPQLESAASSRAQEMYGFAFVTPDETLLNRSVLSMVDWAITKGDAPGEALSLLRRGS